LYSVLVCEPQLLYLLPKELFFCFMLKHKCINPLSDSFCFNLQVVDFYYCSILQEVFFNIFQLVSLYFMLCLGPVKMGKIGDKFCSLFMIEMCCWH